MKRVFIFIIVSVTLCDLLMGKPNNTQDATLLQQMMKQSETASLRNNAETIQEDYQINFNKTLFLKNIAQRNNAELIIVPEPIKTNHVFTIILNNNEDEAEVKIIDLLGKLILKKNMRRTLIVEQKLDRGVYLITVKTSTQTLTKKLIVE
jgi:hypothetical protein